MVDEKLFYKYQRLKSVTDENGNDIIYAIENLANNKLYFSYPTEFNDPFDCKIYLDGKENNQYGEIDTGKLRICCFSGTPKDIKMWSHYADYHKGICLRFRSSIDPRNADDVEYYLGVVAK